MIGGLGPQNTGKGSASSSLEEEVPANVEISQAAPAGTTFPNGMTFTDFVKAISQNIFVPDLIAPSFSLTVGGSSYRIIGSETTFNLIFNFNRGEIKGANDGNGDWNPNLEQAKRAGVANDYSFNGSSNGTSNIKSITETVAQGITQHSATVSYDQGAQPKKSDDSDFSTPFPAGTSPAQTDSYEGVYPIYASTSNITTPTQQSLVSMLDANNLVYDLVAESPGNKQFFDIPDAWLSNRALSKVEYFNTVSGSFDATNKISDFTQSAITKTIAGNTVNYTRFSHNGSNRGAIKIRLKF